MSKASDDIQERELHQLQLMQENAKESWMTSFRLLHSFLQVLNNQFQKLIDWQHFLGFDSEMTEKLFAEYTGIQVKVLEKHYSTMAYVKKSLLPERTHHKRQYGLKDEGINAVGQSQMRYYKAEQFKGYFITYVVDADIKLHHIDQSEPSYDTYLLEKGDSNTTPDSTNMSHRGGEIDQDAEQDQVKSPLLKAEFLKTNDMVEKEVYNELSNRFLQLEKHCISLEISMQQKEESFQSNKPCKNQESPEFREFFEINDLKAQLQAKTTLICNLKNQIKSVKEASNEAKLKKEINVLETINIELESSVAKLLAENEKLNKENEHLKQTYKELYDSIKMTRIQTKDHNDSLIAQVNSKTVENADLKAQIQEKFAKPSILGKPVLQPHRNQSVVRQPTAFKSERCKFSKPRFASQVDVINDLSKPVTPHYVPKVRESVFVKPHHVIASGSSRNSSNESYGSNDMAHKYYLEVAKKKTQDKNTNLKPSVRHTTSLQNTTNGSKPKPRSNNQTSRSFPVPKSSCVPKNMNSRAKVQSPKTRNINKPVEPKSHTQKPGRQIAIGQRFSLNKSSAVREKLNTPRSCLSEPQNGSNEDITNPYECKQSFDVSAGTLNLSAGTSANPKKEGLGEWPRSSTIDDVCLYQFRPRSLTINDVCSHQFRPRSSMTNDVYSHQFRPRSSTTNDSCATQYRTRSYFSDAWIDKFRSRTKSG
ncbi:hypothetical protein Tco_0505081, partial [Tanacetum coccineum]